MYPKYIEGLSTEDESGEQASPSGSKSWARTVLPSRFRQPMGEGDGFDVYVDAARYLPDNVSISRVVCKVMAPSFKVVGQEFTSVAAMDSESLSPAFDAYGAFRLPGAADQGAPMHGTVAQAGNPLRWHPHLTLVVRVDTLESHT